MHAPSQCYRTDSTCANAANPLDRYIVTYGLGIYILNLGIGFLSPAADPAADGHARVCMCVCLCVYFYIYPANVGAHACMCASCTRVY